jgi:hypothetical protein
MCSPSSGFGSIAEFGMNEAEPLYSFTGVICLVTYISS